MERNITTVKFLITISDLQLKQITIQKDLNIHTYFLLVVVVTYGNQVFLHFISIKSKKEKYNEKGKFHTLFFKYRNEV